MQSRLPVVGNQQHHGVDKAVGEILRHQRPCAHAHISHRNTYDGRQHGSKGGRDEKTLEQHALLNPRTLNAVHSGYQQSQAEHAENGLNNIHLIEARDGRRSQKNYGIEQKRRGDTAAEHRINVHLICILFLNNGITKATGDNRIAEGDKDHHNRDHAIVFGGEQTCQHNGDDE